jgi:TolB-like protein/class 3 adenylate cyclase/Flp pilus assembly protein TadD/rhodanese-related sulfurtransferase
VAKDRLPDKLAVILHADVAGSTQLVQQDEHIAHERIQDSFRRFGDTIEKYRGRILELRGDALLAEFERASDAVTATLAFQSDQAYYLSRLKDELKPGIRVGIAMGEVVLGDGTVTGAGVVLAQRIEQLADPGSLCITAALHEALPNRMPFDLENIGEQMLKGFDDPVRVYRVELSPGASIPPPQKETQSKSPQKSWQMRIAIVVGIVAIAIGTAYLLVPTTPMEEPASVEHMAFPLPDKPSIAVLPFTNMSGVAEQEYFADGVTENLITDLSKLSGLFVIARNSSFSYKGQHVKVRQVAEDLGVRYVLEGSVQRAGEAVRINAQLIDATTGGHLWAERYDGSLEDIFALQDLVTQQIVAALKVSLTGEETTKQAHHTTDNAEAHDAFLQGWAHYKLGTPEDLARAIPFFEKAVSLDKNYGLSHAALASIFWDAQINDWSFDLGIPSFEIEDRIEEHLDSAMESPSPLAHDLQARIYLSYSLFDKAVQEAEKAVVLDSNDATAHAALANALILADRPAEGLTFVQDAMRLDPYYPPSYLMTLGAAQFGMENYEEALITFERAVKRNPKSEKSLIYMASCYGHLGRMREAEDAIETANELRATSAGLGALSLESTIDSGFSAFRGKIDWQSFGGKAAQERLRTGLSDIPALTWQYLITYHLDGPDTWAEIEGATEIDLTTAKEFHDRGVLFVDMGTKAEGRWEKVRVSGAINLPWADYAANNRFRETSLNEILKKTEEAVFYACPPGSSCIPVRSTAKAVNWGYQKVYYFKGGAAAWKEAGYPIEKDV